MISSILSRLVILLFGTLYPAYSSYKAVKTRNFKEYTKWMMYWIIFAFFTCAETLTDVFFSWFPFYYEIKIVLVLYLLSPATKGSSILYRKFVHPALSFREQEIDDYISKAKEHSYKQVLDLTSKGVTTILQTAVSSITQIPSTLSSFSNRSLDSAYQESLYTSDSADEFMQLEFSSSEEDYSIEKKVKKDMKEKRSLKKKRSDTNVETRKSSRKVKKTSLELND